MPQAEEKQGPAEKTPGPGPAPLHPGGGDLLRRQPRGLRPVRPGGFGVAAAHLREDPPAPDLRRPLRGHHGAAVHRVHPVPRVGAEPGQGGVPLPGPLHHLPAHRRDLHPHHPGVPGGLEGLGPVRGGVGRRRAGGGPQRRQRGALPEVLHGLLPGHGLGGGAGHGGFLPGGAGRQLLVAAGRRPALHPGSGPLRPGEEIPLRPLGVPPVRPGGERVPHRVWQILL